MYFPSRLTYQLDKTDYFLIIPSNQPINNKPWAFIKLVHGPSGIVVEAHWNTRNIILFHKIPTLETTFSRQYQQTNGWVKYGMGKEWKQICCICCTWIRAISTVRSYFFFPSFLLKSSTILSRTLNDLLSVLIQYKPHRMVQ